MFCLPSSYFHDVMVEKLPFYFASDREIFLDSVPTELVKYWDNKNIRYDLNEYKFRTSHSFSQLKDNEFILATGCSHTFGSGIDKDSMWTSIVEKKLNIPVVNLAVISSDINVLLRNLSVWIKNFAKPKIILIQIPEPTRFSYMFGQGEINTVITSNNDPRDEFKEVETAGIRYHTMYNSSYDKLDFLQSIVSSYKIETHYFSIDPLLEFKNSKLQQPFDQWTKYRGEKMASFRIRFPKEQILARDGSHNGDLINRIWAESTLEILK